VGHLPTEDCHSYSSLLLFHAFLDLVVLSSAPVVVDDDSLILRVRGNKEAVAVELAWDSFGVFSVKGKHPR
jgi:hypothetical protein